MDISMKDGIEKHHKRGTGEGKEKGYSMSEFTWPAITFTLVLIMFKLMIEFDFSMGLLAVFIALLLIFLKDTKSLFYMFIMSLPFSGSAWVLDIGFHTRLAYLFFALLFISFVYGKLHREDYSFTITPLDAPLFLFLFIATLSVFQTAYTGSYPYIISGAFRNYPWIIGFSRILLLICMFMIYYVVINIVKEEGILRKAFILLVITSIIISLYGLAGLSFKIITSSNLPASIDPLAAYSSRIKSVFNEPLFLGNFLLSVLPIVYCLLISKTKQVSRGLLIAALLILSLTLVLTVSRGAWFGFFIFLLIFGAYYRRQVFGRAFQITTKGLFFLLIIFMILLLADSFFINLGLAENTGKILQSASDLTIKPITDAFDASTSRFWSTKVRLWSMQHALEAFEQHPLLGIGYSNYAFYSGFKVYKGLYSTPINFPEVNNYPLKILVETGLIGFIVFIWLVIAILRGAFSEIAHEKDGERKAFTTGYLLSFIAVSAQLMFFSYVTTAYIWVMLAMMMSLCGAKTMNFKIIGGEQR